MSVVNSDAMQNYQDYLTNNPSQRRFVEHQSERDSIGSKGDELDDRWISMCLALEDCRFLKPSDENPWVLGILRHQEEEPSGDASVSLISGSDQHSGDALEKKEKICWYTRSRGWDGLSEKGDSVISRETEDDGLGDFERAPEEIPAGISVFSNIPDGLLSILPTERDLSREEWARSLLGRYKELVESKGSAVYPFSIGELAD